MTSPEIDPNHYEDPFDDNDLIDFFIEEEQVIEESITQIIDWLDSNSNDLDLFKTLTIDDSKQSL